MKLMSSMDDRKLTDVGTVGLDMELFKSKVTESRDLLLKMAGQTRQEAFDFWQHVTGQLTMFMMQEDSGRQRPYITVQENGSSNEPTLDNEHTCSIGTDTSKVTQSASVHTPTHHHDTRKNARMLQDHLSRVLSSQHGSPEQTTEDVRNPLNLPAANTVKSGTHPLETDRDHSIGCVIEYPESVPLAVEDSRSNCLDELTPKAVEETRLTPSKMRTRRQQMVTRGQDAHHHNDVATVRKSIRISTRRKLSKRDSAEDQEPSLSRSTHLMHRHTQSPDTKKLVQKEANSSKFMRSKKKCIEMETRNSQIVLSDGIGSNASSIPVRQYEINDEQEPIHGSAFGTVNFDPESDDGCVTSQPESSDTSLQDIDPITKGAKDLQIKNLQDKNPHAPQKRKIKDLQNMKEKDAQKKCHALNKGQELTEEKGQECGSQDNSPIKTKRTSGRRGRNSLHEVDPEHFLKVPAGYKCTQCQRHLPTPDKAVAHLRMHSGVKPFICEVCKKTFRYHANLKRHERTHLDTVLHPCQYCDKAYVELGQLVIHVAKSHTTLEKPKDNSFPCDQCGRVLKSGSNRKMHIRLCHEGERKFSCTECHKVFQTSSNLKRHMLSHQGLKPWKCNTCEASFTEKRTLERHVRTHTGEKPYRCETCDKQFATEWSLSQHMLLHDGRQSFLCDICGQTFTNKSNLYSHHKVHLNIRPYPCTLCKRKFYSRSDLDRHMRSHTGEKPFLCQVCSKSFSRLEYLREHLNAHAGLTPHHCPLCGKGFSDRSNYHKHVKRCAHKKPVAGDKNSQAPLPLLLPLPPSPPPPSLPPSDISPDYSQQLAHVIQVKFEGPSNGLQDEMSEEQVCALIGQEQSADQIATEAQYALIDENVDNVASNFGEVQNVQLPPGTPISSEDLEQEVMLHQWYRGYIQHVTVNSEPVSAEILPVETLNQ